MKRRRITRRDRGLPLAWLSPLQRTVICRFVDPRTQTIHDVIRRTGRARSTLRRFLDRWLGHDDFRLALNLKLATLPIDRREDVRDALYHFCLSTSLREVCDVPNILKKRTSGWHRAAAEGWRAKQKNLVDDWINAASLVSKSDEEGI